MKRLKYHPRVGENHDKNRIKEEWLKELINQLSAREFAQFMNDNIGGVLTDNVAQER